ncbi:hypothetical protein [Solitalea koreensis]|uniref:Uncharacterized protein n=1 Tax=Solitalea koreensis TaxID=543615 RepID=A0A521CMF6_9SPHI|nr:hypothetical protein [Solitalea koreensis]SMO60622.1 hypothetical protein SAMN06265350_104208 [Solitalea koreensis]
MNADNIRFNSLKHHLGYIQQFVLFPSVHWQDELLTLGHLAFDIYTGLLTVSEKDKEVLQILKTHGVIDRSSYLQFIGNINGYKLISLSDESAWILRWGTDENEFIHLHPARFGQYIIRVKASALKTAIALAISLKNKMQPNLDAINQARNFMQLPIIGPKGMDSIVRLFYMIKRDEV